MGLTQYSLTNLNSGVTSLTSTWLTSDLQQRLQWTKELPSGYRNWITTVSTPAYKAGMLAASTGATCCFVPRQLTVRDIRVVKVSLYICCTKCELGLTGSGSDLSNFGISDIRTCSSANTGCVVIRPHRAAGLNFIRLMLFQKCPSWSTVYLLRS